MFNLIQGFIELIVERTHRKHACLNWTSMFARLYFVFFVLICFPFLSCICYFKLFVYSLIHSPPNYICESVTPIFFYLAHALQGYVYS